MTAASSGPLLSATHRRSSSWSEAVGGLPSLGLAEIDQVSLLARFDQKYLVELDRLVELVDVLGGIAVLEVEGSRCINYTSVYFDSDEMHTYRAHRQGRRRRYKVRTRHYGDPNATMLEVKTKGPRGQTVKHRCAHSGHSPFALDESGWTFVNETIQAEYGPVLVPLMRPVVTTTYRRTTLVDLAGGMRVTVDCDLEARAASGVAGFGGRFAVVEFKSADLRPVAHRELLRLGVRPQRLSKYCLAVGALIPDVSRNRWQPQLRRLMASIEVLPDVCAPEPGWLGLARPS